MALMKLVMAGPNLMLNVPGVAMTTWYVAIMIFAREIQERRLFLARRSSLVKTLFSSSWSPPEAMWKMASVMLILREIAKFMSAKMA